MKTLYLLPIVALLASCADTVPPRAVIVDTKPLTEQVKRVRESGKEVSRQIAKAEESTERAITKAAESKGALAILREALADKRDHEKALASVERINGEISDELEQTKQAFKNLRNAKSQADADVSTLQGVVTSLTVQANKANESSQALEKANKGIPALKEKLSWWRWAAFITWLSVAAIIGVWVFVKWAVITARLSALAISVRSKLPFLP